MRASISFRSSGVARKQIEQATEEELKPLLQEIRALLGQLIMILDDNYELKR